MQKWVENHKNIYYNKFKFEILLYMMTNPKTEG